MSRKTAKIVVDAAMAVVLVALMSTALVQAAPHEWLGVALFVLVGAHVVLNRRWVAAVPRLQYDALHVLRLVVLVGLVCCIVGLMASSLVISKHAFGFLPVLPGAAWARRVHLMCSYWAFVLAFAHAGLHIRAPKSLSSNKAKAALVALVACSCCGVFSFVQLGLWSYLTGQVQFAFVDTSVPLALSMARYASVAVLVATAFCGIQRGLMAAKRRRRGRRS